MTDDGRKNVETTMYTVEQVNSVFLTISCTGYPCGQVQSETGGKTRIPWSLERR
jgi:hypothetical protein